MGVSENQGYLILGVLIIRILLFRVLHSGPPIFRKLPYTVASNIEVGVLGGSWDLVSMVISTLSGVISTYKYSYLNYNPSY